MKKIIIFVLAILVIIYSCKNNIKEDIIIPDQAIRFRVIANSNTLYDQNIKLQLKNILQNKLIDILNDEDNIYDTRNEILENLDEIKKITNDTLKKLNYDLDFDVNYGYNYFPKKEYKGITYKEGKYESLVITLGSGKGDNWWCVLFPPLCLVETDETSVNNAEYKFFVKEIIDKYIK